MDQAADHPWAALVRARGGVPVGELAEVGSPEASAAAFVAILVEDDGLLPAVAKLSPAQLAAHAPDAATDVFLLKSGRVGGPPEKAGSRPVSEGLVTAVLDAALAGEVEWEEDPDLGYLVAASVPGLDRVDHPMLMPRFLYARNDRVYEHAAEVAEVRGRGFPWSP